MSFFGNKCMNLTIANLNFARCINYSSKITANGETFCSTFFNSKQTFVRLRLLRK